MATRPWHLEHLPYQIYWEICKATAHLWLPLVIYYFYSQGGKKLERARDLFEQCLDSCPAKNAKGIIDLFCIWKTSQIFYSLLFIARKTGGTIWASPPCNVNLWASNSSIARWWKTWGIVLKIHYKFCIINCKVISIWLYYFRCLNSTSKKLQSCLGSPILVRSMRKLLKYFQMMELG